jgi:hypothetical protein
MWIDIIAIFICNLMKFFQKSEKIYITLFLNIEEKDILCFLIVSLIITGLKVINQMDQLYCCIFGMIHFICLIFNTVQQVKNTSYKVNKTTLLTLHQQLDFDP